MTLVESKPLQNLQDLLWDKSHVWCRFRFSLRGLDVTSVESCSWSNGATYPRSWLFQHKQLFLSY